MDRARDWGVLKLFRRVRAMGAAYVDPELVEPRAPPRPTVFTQWRNARSGTLTALPYARGIVQRVRLSVAGPVPSTVVTIRRPASGSIVMEYATQLDIAWPISDPGPSGWIWVAASESLAWETSRDVEAISFDTVNLIASEGSKQVPYDAGDA